MDATFWNTLYDVDHYRYGTDPNAFLAEVAPSWPDGARVLVIGDGEGRNGVWLAEQGFDVTTVEPSEVGVGKARSLARTRGVTPRILHGLFPEVGGDDLYDAVVLIYVHAPPAARQQLHAAAVACLVPGGTLLLEAFDKAQLGRDSGGPQSEPLLFDEAMLKQDLAGLSIARLETLEVVLDEGPGHSGAAKVVRLVARKG